MLKNVRVPELSEFTLEFSLKYVFSPRKYGSVEFLFLYLLIFPKLLCNYKPFEF